MSKKNFNILMVGDVFGDPGLDACRQFIPVIKARHNINFVIVNGENSAKDGRGLSEQSVNEMLSFGTDVITTGNHVWRHEKFLTYYLNNQSKILKPINFPKETMGKGYGIFEKDGVKIGVVNAMGRVFFKELLACPFRELESIMLYLKDKVDAIIVDFHAEATSEKQALGFFLDGKATCVYGTHTHVQTADNKILPKGTAYLTDLGFCGALFSCIGVEKNTVINQYLSQMPARYKPETQRPYVFSGAVLKLEIDTEAKTTTVVDWLRVYETF